MIDQTMMDLSLGEFETLIKRAAKGCGLGFGEADDMAASARWVMAHRMAPAGFTHEFLQTLERTSAESRRPVISAEDWATGWVGTSGVFCSLSAGIALSDRENLIRAGLNLSLDNVVSPVFLLPFLAGLSGRTGLVVQACWYDLSVSLNGKEALIDGDSQHLMASAAPVRLQFLGEGTTTGGVPMKPHGRAELSREELAALQALAHRTYAPATEESRLKGAG
ncbi:DUF3726 domain-containing protein [Coralliovum pocilloporae]|uniref:DUF3726 domain-containing protein n=1 Tax=Coralliovum pocilloporae TaxID=3066369 RepID=UPI003306E7BB